MSGHCLRWPRTASSARAITGRAIYQGTLDFAEAQKLADELAGGVFGV